MIRTTRYDDIPKLYYFDADSPFEMDILKNPDKGDRNSTDALRRAIAMLGEAGWELVAASYSDASGLDLGLAALSDWVSAGARRRGRGRGAARRCRQRRRPPRRSRRTG